MHSVLDQHFTSKIPVEEASKLRQFGRNVKLIAEWPGIQVRSTNFRLKKATSKSRNHGYEFDRNVIAELAALFYQVQRLSQEVSDKQKLDPSYVWACGGLFDQAIQKKYAHQAMVDRDGTKSYYITRPMVQEVRKLVKNAAGRVTTPENATSTPELPKSDASRVATAENATSTPHFLQGKENQGPSQRQPSRTSSPDYIEMLTTSTTTTTRQPLALQIITPQAAILHHNSPSPNLALTPRPRMPGSSYESISTTSTRSSGSFWDDSSFNSPLFSSAQRRQSSNCTSFLESCILTSPTTLSAGCKTNLSAGPLSGSSFLGSTNQDSDTRSKANHNVDQYNCGDTIGMDEDHSDTLSQFSDEPNDLAAITLPMAAELFGWSTSSAACETAMEVGPKANPTDTCPQRPFPVPTTAGSAKTRPGARGARQSKRLQAASVVKSKAARHAAATQAAMRQKATRFKKREHMRLIRTLVRSIDQVRRQPELGGLIPKGRIDACKKKVTAALDAMFH